MTALALSGQAGGQYLWYASRGSGVVLLLLFSLVFVLGTAVRLGSAPRGWSRFGMTEIHRALSLFAVALLGLHITTAILDPYVTIGWAAAVLPFTSPYRTLAIGLGAIAVDLAGAVLVTSLLRHRLGYRAWRVVHWLAYLAWPAAFAHSLTAGGDLRVWWVALAECVSVAAVAAAMLARIVSRPLRPGESGRERRDLAAARTNRLPAR